MKFIRSAKKRNKHKISVYFFSFILILITGCSASLNSRLSPETLITTKSIKANLEFLASDELEGREATTKGEKLAALFVSSELKKYGVKPLYDDYLQGYDLCVVSINPESKLRILDGIESNISLQCYEDFFINRRTSISTNGIFNIVFAGYGITAPEFNYDDYSGLNVTGKIVLLIESEPYSTDTAFFNGEEDSRYAYIDYKISHARELGASGVISFSEVYFENWELFKNYLGGDFMISPKKVIKEKLPEFTFNEKSISALLAKEKCTLEEIKTLIRDKKQIPVFEIRKKIEIDVSLSEENKKSYNVIGVIEGSDSVKKHEYVAVGAHYDHLGIIGGKIYNGADDDGSGTSALLEVAKTFAEIKQNERSILIVFHSAEEKGLFGSEYFTNNFDNMKDIAAHINMDMIGRESIDSIYSVGSGKLSGEFKSLVEDVNEQTVDYSFNYKFDDPNDPEKIYYRSDHYNYAKYGIPIVFFYDNMKEDYHQESDEVDKINFDKIRKTALLVYNIALRTSNLDYRPAVDNKEAAYENK